MDQESVVDDGPLVRVPVWRLVVRVAWVAIRLILVFYLGQQGGLFFYQNF